MHSASQVRPWLVLEVDPDSGLILSVDEQLEDALGFARGTLAGQHVSTVSRARAQVARDGPDPIAQVFADATHDLVGPLNQVSSLLGFLVRKTPTLSSDPGSAEILDHLQQAVRRMRTLADGLRTVARVLGEPATRQPVGLAALLSAVLSNSEDKIAAAKAQVSSDRLPTVMADSARLMWVFQELIDNALKFHSGPPKIEIRVEPRGEYWVFSVRDHGPGLDSKSAAHAFRIFRRLDPEKAPGNGVGLTICRQIIAQHHGEIWIESEPGCGTTVFFTLPITGEDRGAEQ
jgi:chemotaxis family two-component system sensor kinase Cph1